MGNSFKKESTKTKVQLSIRNFAVYRLPLKPSKWDYMDEQIWNDLHAKCGSAIPSDATQRRSEYNAWKWYYISGVILFMFGVMYCLAAGVYGLLNAMTILWISAIIVGGGCICIGSALHKNGKKKKKKRGKIHKRFIHDVSERLDARLSTLNNRYDGIIRFSNKGYGKGNILKNQTADSIINIEIKVEILSNDIQYISGQKRNSKGRKKSDNYVDRDIEYAPIDNQCESLQGQMIMVQLDDGRMVPAQIQPQNMQPIQVVVVPQYQQQQQQVRLSTDDIELQVVAQPGGGLVEPEMIAPSAPNQDQNIPPSTNPFDDAIEEPEIIAPCAPNQEQNIAPPYNPLGNDDVIEEEYREDEGEGEGGDPIDTGDVYQYL